MEHRERIHWPDPERAKPIRDSEAEAAATAIDQRSNSTKSSTAAADVANGVKLGYQVIEEQIREGQRLAQRLRQAVDLKGLTNSEDISPLVGRVLHIYKDLGAVCFEAIEALVRTPALRAAISQISQGKSEGGSQRDSSADTVCAVEITSSRPIQVMLKLASGSRCYLLAIHALHAHDEAIPPLTDVRFLAEPATAHPMLRVNIPDTQAPATYTGVVVDAATNEPCGTLCIRLMP
jgi:hypothetical protein